MHRCPFCKFISDPKTGTIFDDRYACPKCQRHPRTFRNLPQKPVFQLGELSVFSRITSTAKLIGYLAAFAYSQKKIIDIKKAKTESDRRLQSMVGSHLDSLKKASYFIPAFAVPHAVTLITNDEWPLLGTAYDLGIAAIIMKMLADPWLQTKEVNV